MKPLCISAIVAAILTSCVNNGSPKSLILFYSQTGATGKVAFELQKQTGAVIERFDVRETYDGDFNATIKRVVEEREIGALPTLVPLKLDVGKYDIIYLAYPVWFGTYPPPVQSLINSVNLEGKTVVPVCTFGSGGLESSSDDLCMALPQSTVAHGFGIRNARILYAEEELNRFLIENGYKEGHVDPLPEYSALTDVSSDERSIYEEATAGYPFPMGEPIAVGRRTITDGVDYLFIVRSNLPDGKTSEGEVFVSERDGRPVEFTKAIRNRISSDSQ